MSSRLKHYQKVQTAQLKHLSEQADIYAGRTKSVQVRRGILEKQKTRNYQSEYDRIRSHLEDSATPFRTKEGLKTRTEHLKALGAKAVSGIM